MTGRYDRSMKISDRPRRKKRPVLRGVVEISSVIFLFYSNLLMGEFTHANADGKTLGYAIRDIFTATNFSIALICSAIGYAVFEFWRRKLM